MKFLVSLLLLLADAASASSKCKDISASLDKALASAPDAKYRGVLKSMRSSAMNACQASTGGNPHRELQAASACKTAWDLLNAKSTEAVLAGGTCPAGVAAAVEGVVASCTKCSTIKHETMVCPDTNGNGCQDEAEECPSPETKKEVDLVVDGGELINVISSIIAFEASCKDAAGVWPTMDKLMGMCDSCSSSYNMFVKVGAQKMLNRENGMPCTGTTCAADSDCDKAFNGFCGTCKPGDSILTDKSKCAAENVYSGMEAATVGSLASVFGLPTCPAATCAATCAGQTYPFIDTISTCTGTCSDTSGECKKAMQDLKTACDKSCKTDAPEAIDEMCKSVCTEFDDVSGSPSPSSSAMSTVATFMAAALVAASV